MAGVLSVTHAQTEVACPKGVLAQSSALVYMKNWFDYVKIELFLQFKFFLKTLFRNKSTYPNFNQLIIKFIFSQIPD